MVGQMSFLTKLSEKCHKFKICLEGSLQLSLIKNVEWILTVLSLNYIDESFEIQDETLNLYALPLAQLFSL